LPKKAHAYVGRGASMLIQQNSPGLRVAIGMDLV
jgi:hypothetical protein